MFHGRESMIGEKVKEGGVPTEDDVYENAGDEIRYEELCFGD